MVHEHSLSSVLSEFARTMLTDFRIQSILDRLVERIVEVLSVTGAGVTLISPGTAPHYVAASDDAALRFERLQTELDEGPCLRAYTSGEPVTVPDLANDDRYPVSAPRRCAPAWRRCSPSRCATGRSAWARWTCTGTHRASWTPKTWRRHRRWPTSCRPT